MLGEQMKMCLVGSRDFGLGILLAMAGSMEDEIKADSGVSALRNRLVVARAGMEAPEVNSVGRSWGVHLETCA